MIITVKDLIDALKACPPDYKIGVSDEASYTMYPEAFQLDMCDDKVILGLYHKPSEPVKLSPEEIERQKDMSRRWEWNYIGVKTNIDHKNTVIPDPYRAY